MLGLLSSSSFSALTKLWRKFISNICIPVKYKTNQTNELKIRIVKLFFKENSKLASKWMVAKGPFLKGTATCGKYKCPWSNFVKEPNNGSDVKNYQNEDKIPD